MSNGAVRVRTLVIVGVVVLLAVAGGSLAAFTGWPAAGNDRSGTLSSDPSAATAARGAGGAGTAAGGAGPAAGEAGAAAPGDTAPEGDDPLADGGVADGTLSVTGSVNGPITQVSEVGCSVLGGGYTWSLSGAMDGVPVVLEFVTNYYRGAGAYNTTGISDQRGGYLNLRHGPGADAVTVGSDGGTKGSLTVAPGERSGSIDADLRDMGSGQEVHVSGQWTCS
jgi:hypothetical protein